MNSPEQPNQNRRIRVFVSSTFRDMMGERDELMTHAWPELRRFCRERQVELVEVDLRWGIAEEQSTRKETLKLCLDEIRACRPFFIGLLGERYGWVPGDDAFTGDLLEEQPWLVILRDRSVTELEIIHGVLREAQMHKRAFFYFRDPSYLDHLPPGTNRADFESESQVTKSKLNQLKQAIRHARDEGVCKLHETYPDPVRLAAQVLEDLKAAIEAQFPIENIPDTLTREARDHEAFAETRRRTYIGRPDYFEALDRHAAGDGTPLVLLGDSGSGKSALLANWLEHWRKAHPKDFLFQHYIGGTPDSAEHWRLMTRLIAEIKRWTDDPEELPKSHDDLLKTLPVWLAKARIKAERDGVRCLLVLDALNQLEDRDHARLLGWLPVHPFTGALRLVVSTLPGDTLDAVTQRGWKSLRVEQLTSDERCRMIADYLQRFGKKLDAPRLERIAAAPAAANPLYLKILLDELRVTGTHERLDERLQDYLAATDIPALLKKVLARYQHDYERDRPGLVSEALGLIWAARRGLTETELLRLLIPANLPQLPLAVWTPLRSALEEGLVDRGGILNFAHDFLRTAVETAFVPDEDKRDELRIRLADDFRQQPISARNCDELPWLLWQAKQRDRLRAFLLDIDRFIVLRKFDENELLSYWIWLAEERVMGQFYLSSLGEWRKIRGERVGEEFLAEIESGIGSFLDHAALYEPAVALLRRSLNMCVRILGREHPGTLSSMNKLAEVLKHKGDFSEATELCQKALEISEKIQGPEHPETLRVLNNIGELLVVSPQRYVEAEAFFRRAFEAREKVLGPDHPDTLFSLNDVAACRGYQGDFVGAEPLFRRVLVARTRLLGQDHPATLDTADNLAYALVQIGRYEEAEQLCANALKGRERVMGFEHPDTLKSVNNNAIFLRRIGKHEAAADVYRRAVVGYQRSLGAEHGNTLHVMRNLAIVLADLDSYDEAEHLLQERWIVCKHSLGDEHPTTLGNAKDLTTLIERIGDKATFSEIEGDSAKAESLFRRALVGTLKISSTSGRPHPNLQTLIGKYASCLANQGRSPQQVLAQLNAIGQPFGIQFGSNT